MAYMNLETYDVFNTLSKNVETDKFVEIDELIAPIISLLNKKGYKTQYCCSGHPYTNYILDPSGDENWDDDWNRDQKEYFDDNPYITGYIMFEPGILIHSCPKDTKLEMEKDFDSRDPVFVLRYHYDLSDEPEISTLSMYKTIVYTMSAWMEWAQNLPVYNPMISLAMLAKYVSYKSEDFNVDTFINILEKFQGDGNYES